MGSEKSEFVSLTITGEVGTASHKKHPSSLLVYRLVHTPVTRESWVRLPGREFLIQELLYAPRMIHGTWLLIQDHGFTNISLAAS